jgi:carotenoid cleavage dioxygenase-like enzyme
VPDHTAGFRSAERETAATQLVVEGRLPSWLGGALLRTGPARFEVGAQTYRHWFDGLALLHRFAFGAGSVTYSSRFLESRAYRAARDDGRIAYSEFATDPCRSLFQRVATLFAPPRFGDNANVNISRLDDRFVALSETPLPVVFDPVTLETLGVAEPAPGQLTVAHPHRAPTTGARVSYATHFGPFTTYRVTVAGRVVARLPVARPAYMHSFAVTERHVVLVEFPFVAVPVAIPLSGRPFIENFRWRPRRGTRLRVLDLESGGSSGTFETEPFFAFHHVNAYEDGDELVLDLCAYDDARIVGSLSLETLRRPAPQLPTPRLRRLRVRPRDGRVETEPLPDVAIELPRIDYERSNGRRHRVVYGVGPARPGAFLERIAKVDVAEGDVLVWAEDGTYPGEPVYVPSPGAAAEDDGVLLSVVLDAGAGTSFLLVLDARDLRELARARVPEPVPFGFHGQHFADA